MAVLATMPALVVILYTQSVDRERAREQVLTDIQQITRLAASQQATVFDGVRRLLLTLAQFPALRASDPAGCRAVLPSILRDHPGYLNIWVAKADGSPFCEAIPVNPSTSSAGRSWFERAMTTRTTAVGDYQIGMSTGKPDVVLAHPLLGPSGTVDRIVAAAIGLDQLNDIASRSLLPPGAALTLFDRNRTILARYPDGAGWIGKAVPEPIDSDGKADRLPRVADIVGTDGVARLYATAPVETDLDTGLRVGMGIEREAAFAPANRLVRQQWWLLALVTLATIGAALIGGEWFVRRPINQLAEVTHLLAAGDLTARARLARAMPGLVELANAVNAMAIELEARHREQQEVEANLRLSEEKLRQSQTLEAVGQLAAGIAHNFNNLLTVTAGYTDLLLASHTAADQDRADLEEISKATRRGAALTRQLLAFSRKHDPAPTRVDLNHAIDDLREILTRLIREDIRLTIELTSTPMPVFIDPHDLEQVILNLVLNARDALPSGGDIQVDTARVPIGTTDSRLDVPVTPGEYVRLRVRDNGVGMTSEVRAHLFEPFFTTKEVGKGTGLGLASVYGIVRQSRGFIDLDSSPGAGTTFGVYIPMTSEAPDEATAQPSTSPSKEQRPGATILLVEDEEPVRAVAAHVLSQAGYRVMEAATPAQACEIFDRHANDIALLLTDVVMPEMSGHTLADRLVARQPSLRVLFMSGYSDEMPSIRAGQARFLGKPFSPSSLVATVADLLGAPTARG